MAISRTTTPQLLWCTVSPCNTHTKETKLQCSSDVYTCMSLVPPADPATSPPLFLQTGSLGAKRDLYRGDKASSWISAWGWTRSAHGRERGCFGWRGHDLHGHRNSGTIEDTFGSGLCTSLHTSSQCTENNPTFGPRPPLFYQAGVINITVGMFFIMGSDMLFFMGECTLFSIDCRIHARGDGDARQ